MIFTMNGYRGCNNHGNAKSPKALTALTFRCTGSWATMTNMGPPPSSSCTFHHVHCSINISKTRKLLFNNSSSTSGEKTSSFSARYLNDLIKQSQLTSRAVRNNQFVFDVIPYQKQPLLHRKITRSETCFLEILCPCGFQRKKRAKIFFK